MSARDCGHGSPLPHLCAGHHDPRVRPPAAPKPPRSAVPQPPSGGPAGPWSSRGSGILSVLGLLGRGTHASSSREIRKLPFLPAPRYLYQHGGAPRAARPRRQDACAELGGYPRGRRAGGHRLLRFHLGEGAGAQGETSRLYKDGGRAGAVISVPSRARLLSRAATGRGLLASAASSRPPSPPLSPLRVPGASPASPPSARASCLGPLVRPSSRRGMPRGSVGRWG